MSDLLLGFLIGVMAGALVVGLLWITAARRKAPEEQPGLVLSEESRQILEATRLAADLAVGSRESPEPSAEPAWWASALNRRATVEQWMFDAARGRRPMPTRDELRAWAIKLGTPGPSDPVGVEGKTP